MNEEEHVARHLAEERPRVPGEEVARYDAVSVPLHELVPGAPGALAPVGPGPEASLYQNPLDRVAAAADVQLLELTGDALIAPLGVLIGHADDKGLDAVGLALAADLPADGGRIAVLCPPQPLGEGDWMNDADDALDGRAQLAAEEDELGTLFRRGDDLVFHTRTEYPVFDAEEFILANELGVDDLRGQEEDRM